MPGPIHVQVIEKILISYLGLKESGQADHLSIAANDLAVRHRVSYGKVWEILTGWEQGATLAELARPGMKDRERAARLLDVPTKAVLRELVETNRTAYLVELSLELQARTGKEVSLPTLCRGLQELGLTRKLVRVLAAGLHSSVLQRLPSSGRQHRPIAELCAASKQVCGCLGAALQACQGGV